MKCSKCGKDFDEGIFCPYCGKRNQLETTEESSKGYSIYWRISIITILLIMIIAVVIIIFANSGKVNKSAKFIDLLKNGETEEALSIYQSDIINDSVKLAETYAVVKADIEAITEDYYSEVISYEDAINKLGVYAGFYDTDIEEAVHQMDSLKVSKEAFYKAESEFTKGNYRESYELYMNVIQGDRNYEIAKAHKEDSYHSVKEDILATGATLFEQGKYSDAMSYLKNERSFLHEEDLKAVDEIINDCYKRIIDDAIKKLEEYKDNQDYIRGIQYIDSMPEGISDNEIQSMRNMFVEEYEVGVTNMVASYKERKEYTEAIQFVRKARTELPESTLISEMESELKDYLPISLSDVFCFKGPEYTANSPIFAAKDMYQNEYSEAFLYYVAGTNGYDEVWLVNSEYQHFSAWLTPFEWWSDSYDAKATAYFEIYTDDVKIQEISITRDSKPVKVEVDLTGVEKIKFYIRNSEYKYLPSEILLANPSVFKKY